ncbi:MAG: tetratricopeptide repeat protein [Desulfobacterium sp.]|jgi:tetratricopeptide (TPR) repeat protein|nr:tetratricopeptide repeat protein [Desulfobacterium sp.]
MSLLRDYLEKTEPKARPGQDAQIPPMLRQGNKKGRSGLLRRLQAMVVLLVLLFFSGYVFKASFEGLTARPPEIPSRADAAPEIKPSAASNAPTTPGDVNVSSVGIKSVVQEPAVTKPEPLPVKAAANLPVEAVKELAMIFQTERPDSLQIQGKLQAAMAANKPKENNPGIRQPDITAQENTVVLEQYAKPPAAGPEDYFNLGLAAQKRGNIDQALGYYRKVLNLKPDHSKALVNLSAIHIKTGNSARAMSILEKLHIQEPENVDAMVNLGILFLKENEHARAETLFEKALYLQGHNTTVLFNLAYLNQLQNNLERAGAFYARISEIDGDNTKALLAAGSIQEKQKKLPQALGSYVQALNTTEVKNSEPLRIKIENRIRLLQQIAASADPMTINRTINSEETHE